MTKQNHSPHNPPLSPLPDDSAGIGRRVTPRQSNHESYVLPVILDHLPPMPLYLAVAHFGLLTEKPLSREMICQAFHLDTRRALEIMRYLVNGAPRVTCKCLSLMQGQGYCLRILAIATPEQAVADAAASRTAARPRGSTAEREQAQQQMRQWFLRRPLL
ncbi:CaiF/GrlA family transcriptional regulator [Serratia bockelmannii]|uniref:CaiF/GrlA family transcriptional regulator n=1 Tax=Serratia TaxID=613 RepID=UPI00235E5AD9|nr:CaiF/GrlA family transcriptional regulator [Serratia bockelmannii]